MKKLSIKIFGEFCVSLNGKELPFSKTAAEFLALLICMRGGKVTAKSIWNIIYKDKGIPYSSKYYLDNVDALREELELFGLLDIIHLGTRPVRSCRLVLDKIECDYYDLLENATEMQPKELFLPDYTWAQKLYCNNLNELRSISSM